MSKVQRYTWFVFAVLFAAALVVFSLHQIVLHPSHIVPELGGDGAKNNFTYLYQCMYGKGYWFDGMNYPYGEHIVYTDGLPVLSVPFTYFKNVAPGDALRVLWLLISFSFFLSIVFLYRILTHFKVAPWAAILFAGLIGIFSPQLFRLQGHYALSFACVIPMLFYWTIKYLAQFKWRYPVYFFITGCVMSFIHPYYAAMMLIWVLCFTLGYFIFIREGIVSKIKYTLPLMGSAILVLVVVAIVMKATDPVTDRPETPFNSFYETCTHIAQLVTSSHSPIWQKDPDTPRYSLVRAGGEGYAYLGFTIIIVVIVSLIIGIIRFVRKKQVDIIADPQVFSPIWLFMAFAGLLFGMGVPFVWHMQWLFDYIAIFRQFRSLGRFTWIFYYIIAVYTAVVVYTVYARCIVRRKYVVGYAVLLLAIGLWSYEASGYINYSRKLSLQADYNYGVIFSEYSQNWTSFLEEHHYNAHDFQAELLLPFFHIGTEKLWVGDPGWLCSLGSRPALQLHLPIVDVMLSRSSWSEAMKQVKIAAGPYVEKPLLHDIKSNKPFLLLTYDDAFLNPDQAYLLEASDYIGHLTQTNVYACYPERIAANDKKNADSVMRILPVMKQPDTIIANDGVVYYDHFDSQPGNGHLFGAGGGPVIHQDDSTFLTIPITTAPKDSEAYEFSCWFLVGRKDYRSPYVSLLLLDGRDSVIGTPNAICKLSTDNNGMWLRAGIFFKMPPACRSIRCTIMNDPKPTYLAMDEVLLRPAHTLVISKAADGKVMVNNHLFNTGR